MHVGLSRKVCTDGAWDVHVAPVCAYSCSVSQDINTKVSIAYPPSRLLSKAFCKAICPLDNGCEPRPRLLAVLRRLCMGQVANLQDEISIIPKKAGALESPNTRQQRLQGIENSHISFSV